MRARSSAKQPVSPLARERQRSRPNARIAALLSGPRRGLVGSRLAGGGHGEDRFGRVANGRSPTDFGAVWLVVVPVALRVAPGLVTRGFPPVVVCAGGATVVSVGGAGVGPGQRVVGLADENCVSLYVSSDIVSAWPQCESPLPASFRCLPKFVGDGM